MIFAPRSWPSKPAFAMTTRIFRTEFIRRVDERGLAPSCRQVYGGAADRHRLLPGLAEPGERAVGLPRRGTREAASRLRSGRSRASPRDEDRARRDRDRK